MIIFYIVLYLLIGFILACLVERAASESMDNPNFIMIALLWAPVFAIMTPVIIFGFIINTFSSPSKLRKWLRGF